MPFDDDGLRVYELNHAGERSWIAWFDSGKVILPGDEVPEMTVELQTGGTSVIVEPTITRFGQEEPDRFTLETVDGVINLTLTPSPVFLYGEN